MKDVEQRLDSFLSYLHEEDILPAVLVPVPVGDTDTDLAVAAGEYYRMKWGEALFR